jgi:hypothetical protein
MKEDLEENVMHSDDDYKQISLFGFIIGFFVFMFDRFVKP